MTNETKIRECDIESFGIGALYGTRARVKAIVFGGANGETIYPDAEVFDTVDSDHVVLRTRSNFYVWVPRSRTIFEFAGEIVPRTDPRGRPGFWESVSNAVRGFFAGLFGGGDRE